MSAQRYSHPIARERMSHSLCPECGTPAATHSDDMRFWIPRACDLTPRGVTDRIEQYQGEADE